MAQSISLISGSPLINSPIVYAVKASVVSGTVSFHRLMLQVTAGLSGGNNVDYTLSSPVDSGETVNIDISSALRSAANGYEYTSTPPSSYPYVSFSLKAWDEYMQNGEVHENVAPVTNSGGKALLGGYSDLDRLMAGASKTTLKFTRKPTSMPEVICDGETLIRPGEMSATIGNISSGPSSVSYAITIDDDHPAGLRTVGGVQVYVAPKRNDRYQFRFINTLGVMESIGVNALRETTMAVTKNDYTLTRQETFNSFSRYLQKKQNDVETWKMASGPVDNLWQQWFLHDFLMTEHCWIYVSEMWLPCIISPEESVTAVNRHGHSVMQVLFDVKFDINGSPFLSV